MTISIIGAGMAGLLAGNMLKKFSPQIYEAQKILPNNHSAVLRFRTPVVGDVLNIPFERVTMIKTVAPWKNPVADALAYSYKNTGALRSDRSILAGTVVGDRWVAPPDLITRMAEGIEFNFEYDFNTKRDTIGYGTIVSTLPMPVLMAILDYPDRGKIEFKSTPGVNIKLTVPDCDAYVSVLIPDPKCPVSRISITGSEVIFEMPNTVMIGDIDDEIPYDGLMAALDKYLGLRLSPLDWNTARASQQKYAKIAPIDNDRRRDFMFWATDKYQIFSLGRYATWRPGLLLDDLVQDLRLIERWIRTGNKYEIARHR